MNSLPEFPTRADAQDVLLNGVLHGIHLPYQSFGNVDSLDLFGVNELMLFAFYKLNAPRYKSARDIGANIGLHAIIMARQGWNVIAYEPDPKHYAMLRRNVDENRQSVGSSRVAVSDQSGLSHFVRVLGNTTGNHILGDKVPYGDTEPLIVATIDAREVFEHTDFAKIDAEGHEAVILSRLTPNCEVMSEVGNVNTAKAIFDRFVAEGRPMYSQKTGWRQVFTMDDMPIHHSDGSLFIGVAQ